MKKTGNLRLTASTRKSPISRLTAAALVLPGLIPVVSQAAEDDSIDFQYSHYQEGRRDGYDPYVFDDTGVEKKVAVPNNLNPIEVESLHGSARISLTDRVKFAFNYIQDTWSGATPFGSAPQQSGALEYYRQGSDAQGNPIFAGASPYFVTRSLLTLKDKNQLVYPLLDQITGLGSAVKDRMVHVMGYASPETRQQGDFKLSYQWDEAAIDLGGGISVENDYESRFVNVGSRLDFNQKQTTLDLSLSYTHSDIHAEMDQLADNFFTWTAQHNDQIKFNPVTGLSTLSGTRQDWGVHLGLTQIFNQDSIGKLGINYTRSTGFLENPYKVAWVYDRDSANTAVGDLLGMDIVQYSGRPFIEQRPDERNLWQWSTGWVQYVAPLDAALHFDYSFAHDDWGINAHTFEADWVQPVGSGWTITPRIRYYSQSAADFYSSYFFGGGKAVDYNADPNSPISPTYNPPKNFSSDQRLSGFGTLSGGVTVSKDFAKGLSLQAGFEYYTHQGGLMLGGGGEGSFADYDYWVANAALKVNLSAVGRNTVGNHVHDRNHAHPNIPAGVWFGHTLDRTGDMMVGYRYQRNWQAGSFLHGDSKVNIENVIANGCPDLTDGCTMLPREMTMNMHMLDIMYAPTDWLTLMLMPQFMDMAMPSFHPNTDTTGGPHSMHGANVHDLPTGGVGDTGMYALVNLFNRPNHHLHLGLGVSAPTGDVAIKQRDPAHYTDTSFNHYGMQLGSGTWDLKPSLTYTGKSGDWSWGAQIAGTKRLESRNSSGYALGDIFETSVWDGYDWTNWLSSTIRVAYNWQGSVHNRFHRATYDDFRLEKCNPEQPDYNQCLNRNEDTKIAKDNEDRPAPMDYPGNYGGNYVDVGFGLSATVPTGAFAGNRLAFEWLQPVYTDVNGYQLDRDGALSFTWSYGF